MAPEYALWGYLSYKADVYSFGIVLLEIVSGKNNNNYAPSDNFICLLDWVSSFTFIVDALQHSRTSLLFLRLRIVALF